MEKNGYFVNGGEKSVKKGKPAPKQGGKKPKGRTGNKLPAKVEQENRDEKKRVISADDLDKMKFFGEAPR